MNARGGHETAGGRVLARGGARRLAPVALCGALAWGCGGSSPAAKAPAPCPPQDITVALLASPQLNAQEGQGRPMVARVYQLKDDAKLRNAPFDAIWKDDKTTLGDDMVAVEEVQLYPGRRADKRFDRPETVNHVAVVGLFQNVTGKGWVSTVDLPPLPEPGRCYTGGAAPDDDFDDRPPRIALLPFWFEEARVVDGAEHLDDCPKPGEACLEARKPRLKKAAPERQP